MEELEDLKTEENNTCELLVKSNDQVTIYPTPTNEPRLVVEGGTIKEQKNEVPRILAGKRVLYVNGCFGYKADLAPEYSRFCFFLDPSPALPLDAWNVKPCPRGNKAG
jgi:hypothetical protein